MSTLVRYFHIRPIVKRARKNVVFEKGGATVRVEHSRFGFVNVGYILCSAKDSFVKNTGRVMSAAIPVQEIPLRYLGGFLTEVAEEVEGLSKLPTQATDYNFAMKYFLPK